MAPETCIDFDAPHVTTTQVLLSFAGMFALLGCLGGYVAYKDPVGSNPVALRSTVIPFNGLKDEMGWIGEQNDDAVEDIEEN